MKIQGAVIKEQGVTFAVVIVKSSTLTDKSSADSIIIECQPIFGNIPVVLMAQDSAGTPTYYGREDISRFMASVPLEAVPWMEYTIG